MADENHDYAAIIREGMAEGAAASKALMQQMRIEAILELQLTILAKLDKRNPVRVKADFKQDFDQKFIAAWEKYCEERSAG